MNNLKRLENILYYSGLAIAIFILTKTLYLRFTLPQGVCPFTNNYYPTILSISLLLVSQIIPLICKYLDRT